ncbi:MAG: Ig-like domain-containing protein [Solirubrobacterales bacterium]
MATSVASAYWTDVGSGTATALTSTMPGGTTPTVSEAGTTVTVNISQVSVSGQLVGLLGGGYTVKRYPAAGGAAVTPGGTCGAIVTGFSASLSCTETNTPPGDWRYTVSPTLYQWTSAESAMSAMVVITPDPATGLGVTRAPAADMDLDWTAAAGATGYNVYRRTTAGAYNFATPLNGATPVSGTTYTDTTSVSGSSYNYVVHSVVIGSSGQQIASGNSNETAALTADGTNPTGVTLAAVPANLSADETFTGNANDTISGVATVYFEYRTSPAGAWTEACAETTSPYTCDFDTTAAADGLYDFRTRAVDGAGNTTLSAVQTNRRIDNINPTATVNAVAAYVRGTIALGGTAADAGSGLASISLQYRLVGAPTWTTLCTPATSPVSCNLNTTTRPDGLYEVQMVVTDNAGNVGIDTSAVDFTIDNTAPSITMSDPGANLAGIALLESTVSDAGSGVASVQYQYKLSSGATWINACSSAVTPYSCNFDTASVADGTYDFRAIATDALVSQATSATITTRVIDNTNPASVTITNPGTPLRATITLNAAATDTGGGVANVAIERSPAGLNSWTTICTDTTTPYSCSFDTTTVADGLYDFRAVATDNSGNSATSVAVTGRRIDNTAPVVTLTNPGTPRRGTVALAATATDGGSGMASVAFQYTVTGGGTWTTISTDAATPFAASFNTAALNGTYDIRALATDLAGNQSTSVATGIVLDNTVPTAVDIQTASGGGTLGRPDAGDTITFTFSEPMAPATFLAGWTGASTAVRVRLSNAGTDRLRIRNATSNVNLPFGTVRIGTAWVTTTANFNATMVMSGNTVVVTMGTQINGTVGTSAANSTMIWTPSATATDIAGNPMSTTARNETGAADGEF